MTGLKSAAGRTSPPNNLNHPKTDQAQAGF